MTEPLKQSFKQGWALFKDSFVFLFKRPIFLGPIFIAWVAVAAIVLGTRYVLVPRAEQMTLGVVMLTVFTILVAFTYTIILANTIMLEFIYNIERGEKPTWRHALRKTFIKNTVKLIPIAIIWSGILLITILIRALTSKKRSSKKPEPSVQDAARTLSGMNTNPFSWLTLGLRMFEKLVRMTVFLSLPAVAWEGKGPFAAFGKAFRIIKQHPVQFLSSYTLTGVAGMLMALPLVPIYLLNEADVQIATIVWWGVIMYSGFTWTLGIYLEQMSVGLLYLWHYKWEQGGSRGDLTNVPKPDLLDDVHEFQSKQTEEQKD
ncbi:MAG: hypothetical protein Q8P01_05100 [bacterium]|nr:hypothetical protein [bacterium]